MDTSEFSVEQRILMRMRELVAAGWTQGPLATDKYGSPASLWGKNAVNFCVRGAYYRATFVEFGWDEPPEAAERAWRKLRGPGGISAIRYNEAPWVKQEHVLRMIDNALVKVGVSAPPAKKSFARRMWEFAIS